MGLFSPAWKSNNEKKALACVARTEDQARLEQIAGEAPVRSVRLCAAAKLTEAGHVHRMALGSSDPAVRALLAEKASDQSVLMRLAGQDPDRQVRRAALPRIADERFLMAFAAKIDDQDLALLAVKHLHSEGALAALAAGCERDSVVQGCLRELGDSPAPDTVRLLKDARSTRARRYAYARLSEAEQARLSRTEPDADLRVYLIKLLTDADALMACAKEDGSGRCRWVALDALDEKALCRPEHRDALYAIATGDSDRDCRETAFEILQGLKPKLDPAWWAEHIDEAVDDQQLAALVRASDADPKAADAVARRIVEGRNDRYLHARCGMPVVEALEKLVSAGDGKAAKALHALYTSRDLNPALSGHAAAQQRRFTSSHRDRWVDSSVCGEVQRHDDYQTNWSILPR